MQLGVLVFIHLSDSSSCAKFKSSYSMLRDLNGATLQQDNVLQLANISHIACSFDPVFVFISTITPWTQ